VQNILEEVNRIKDIMGVNKTVHNESLLNEQWWKKLINIFKPADKLMELGPNVKKLFPNRKISSFEDMTDVEMTTLMKSLKPNEGIAFKKNYISFVQTETGISNNFIVSNTRQNIANKLKKLGFKSDDVHLYLKYCEELYNIKPRVSVKTLTGVGSRILRDYSDDTGFIILENQDMWSGWAFSIHTPTFEDVAFLYENLLPTINKWGASLEFPGGKLFEIKYGKSGMHFGGGFKVLIPSSVIKNNQQKTFLAELQNKLTSVKYNEIGTPHLTKPITKNISYSYLLSIPIDSRIGVSLTSKDKVSIYSSAEKYLNGVTPRFYRWNSTGNFDIFDPEYINLQGTFPQWGNKY
jgi:hypothetical protein